MIWADLTLTGAVAIRVYIITKRKLLRRWAVR